MRYILSLALLSSACTRANPDAVGGNGGGSAGTGGGGAGGGAAGGGGTGGGGGATGGVDLAMSTPHDMAMRPDMATLDGVACGQASCINGEDCCISNNGEKCTYTQQCSGGSHPTLWAGRPRRLQEQRRWAALRQHVGLGRRFDVRRRRRDAHVPFAGRLPDAGRLPRLLRGAAAHAVQGLLKQACP